MKYLRTLFASVLFIIFSAIMFVQEFLVAIRNYKVNKLLKEFISVFPEDRVSELSKKEEGEGTVFFDIAIAQVFSGNLGDCIK